MKAKLVMCVMAAQLISACSDKIEMEPGVLAITDVEGAYDLIFTSKKYEDQRFKVAVQSGPGGEKIEQLFFDVLVERVDNDELKCEIEKIGDIEVALPGLDSSDRNSCVFENGSLRLLFGNPDYDHIVYNFTKKDGAGFSGTAYLLASSLPLPGGGGKMGVVELKRK